LGARRADDLDSIIAVDAEARYAARVSLGARAA
jgi:hypothetical protein